MKPVRCTDCDYQGIVPSVKYEDWMYCPLCKRHMPPEPDPITSVDAVESAAPAMTTHGTGAVRSSDADAVRYDLISPIALESWARTCAEGAAKYGDFNWEKGFPVPDSLNHAIRHLYLFLSGDRSEDHLGHALWNVGAAIHSHALWTELNENKLRRPGCLPPESAAPVV